MFNTWIHLPRIRSLASNIRTAASMPHHRGLIQATSLLQNSLFPFTRSGFDHVRRERHRRSVSRMRFSLFVWIHQMRQNKSPWPFFFPRDDSIVSKRRNNVHLPWATFRFNIDTGRAWEVVGISLTWTTAVCFSSLGRRFRIDDGLVLNFSLPLST